MARFRNKRVAVAVIIILGIIGVLHRSQSNNFVEQYSQEEVMERMNVYDRFVNLAGENEKAVESRKKASSSKIDYSKFTDVLSMERPHYLDNYKNPCWKDNTGNVSRIRCLPYFHILGVDKCGTTDLWSRIEKHPEIFRNDGIGGKETHWWSWRRFGFDIWVENKMPWTFENYLNVFDAAAKKIESVEDTLGVEDDYHPAITGEGSPTTFWDFTGWNRMPQNEDKTADTAMLTPHAMKHLNPKTNFILLFRDPVERLYSDYMFLDLFRQTHNVSANNFHDSVLRSIQMFQDCQKTQSVKSCLYDKQLHMRIPVRIFVGMYVVYLKQWFQVFDKSQFLILQNEEYSKDIKKHVLRVFMFLNLKSLPDEDVENIVSRERAFDQSSKRKSVGPMKPETKTILNQFYKQYNEELAVLLNDKKYLWHENS